MAYILKKIVKYFMIIKEISYLYIEEDDDVDIIQTEFGLLHAQL